MAQLHEGLDHVQEQLSLTDGELALNALARNITSTQSELRSAEQSLSFTHGHKPTDPGARPHPEAGGMDHEDYAVAAWEYSHHDEEKEEDINRYSAIIDDAEYTLSDLFDLKERVDGGDKAAAQSVAAKERARLQAIADEIKVKTTEFEHQDATDLASAITGLMGAENLKELEKSNRVGPNGWKVSYSFAGVANPESSRYTPTLRLKRNPGKGPFKEFTEELEINYGVEPGHFSVSHGTIPEDSGLTTSYNGGLYDKQATKPGDRLIAQVENGVIVKGFHTKGRAYKGAASVTNVVSSGSRQVAFTEQDASALLSTLRDINADVEAIS
jgi:hypothetical protein